LVLCDWGDLIVSLEDCPADEPIDDILDSAEQQLSNLPDEERTVSEEYWARDSRGDNIYSSVVEVGATSRIGGR
jgi:hypothetical protein